MLRKSNKVDYTGVKTYQVISFLNCLGKVYEKVVAEVLADWYEVYHILYEDQMRSHRQRSAIDAVARVPHHVQ